ncbi:anti sigma factor C-terminal domain-containing protein [Wukongibacter baidiensis]|uniref:anti-sigma factor n=1 Tax=Wukongibacter baidiensis TaxID=1723361 RepID=UPI003D7FB42C
MSDDFNKEFKNHQEILDEELNIDKDKKTKEPLPNNKKDKRKQKVSKWKTRFNGVLTAIIIMILLNLITTILSNAFYTQGEPHRMEIYEDVVESTLYITEPNLKFRSRGTKIGQFFTMKMKAKLIKQVGKDEVRAGDVDVKFLFGLPSDNGIELFEDNWDRFCHPKEQYLSDEFTNWERLEKLPEGTVAEAYISFDKLYETDEVLKKFVDRDLDLLWFAVDTGMYKRHIHNTIGFPYSPIWHHDDMILGERTVEKGKFFTSIISESRHSPVLEAYGSADLRNENFIKTLKLVNEHELIAKKMTFKVRNLQEKIDYIDENGVKLYGIVITGPSKKILKLKNEEWVRGISIGEVRLWNWE